MPGDDARRSAGKEFEQREFAARQSDKQPGSGNLPQTGIDDQVFNAMDCWHGYGSTARNSANAGEKNIEGEGLGQIVVSTEIQGANDVLSGIAGGEDQDGSAIAAAPQLAGDFKAIEAWEHQVENHQVEGESRRHSKGAFAVGFGCDLVAFFLQSALEQVGDSKVVFDDQHAHRFSISTVSSYRVSRFPEGWLKSTSGFSVSSGSTALLESMMRNILSTLALAGLLNAQGAKAPALVMEAFQKAYPQAKLKTVKPEKRNGKTVYELESTNASGNLDVLYSDKGELIESEESMPVADLPAEVSAAIKTKHPKATVVSAEKVTSASGIKFEMIIQEGKKKKEITLDSAGRFQ